MSSSMISIVGEKEKFSLEKVQKSVVLINNEYYWRTSDLIVKIPEKNNRYYRKASDYVCQDYDGVWRMKASCITLRDGKFAPNDPDIVVKTAKGEYILRWDAITEDETGHFVHRNDEYDVCCLSGVALSPKRERFILGYSANELPSRIKRSFDSSSMSRNKGRMFISSKMASMFQQCYISKSYYFRKDLLECVVNSASWDTQLVYRKLVDRESYDMIIIGFNGDTGDYNACRAVYGRRENYPPTKTIPGLDLPVPSQLYTSMKKHWSEFNKLNKAASRSSYISMISKNKDSDPKVLVTVPGRSSGGIDYYKPTMWGPTLSETLRLTGGKGYSFGIEMESEMGSVPDHLCEKHMFLKTGDGSLHNEDINLMTFEYVSNILHGDQGVNRVVNFLPIFSKYTLQGTKCSTHIHVGGFPGCDSPDFTRQFSINAIKLGAQIEEGLFALLPSSRNPQRNKHCSSIARYGQMIKDGYDPEGVLARVVFGDEVTKFDSIHNEKSRLNRWCKSRYRWLNLVNCNTDNSTHSTRGDGFKTIEFRAFPATTNPMKIQAYILFSLGFTWFIENRAHALDETSLTLKDVMDAAYRGTEAHELIMNFCEGKLN